PEVLELLPDKARPARQTYRGAIESIVLDETVSARLRRLSRAEGSTMFMLMLSAFNVLLHRYSGQDDILVGTPIENRGRKEIEGLVGCFLNTLVLRSNLGAEESFRQLLRGVREACLQGYMHQDLPFELLVEELQPERAMSHSPVFQVML